MPSSARTASRVHAASVVIVSCGGVGSWMAVMLARSGVTKLRLVDFDYVTLSSLNRHATAAIANVGMPKVECIVRALRAIAVTSRRLVSCGSYSWVSSRLELRRKSLLSTRELPKYV